ncbi:unnamed protein product, partial [Discosporangium mesarthrocarpum]
MKKFKFVCSLCVKEQRRAAKRKDKTKNKAKDISASALAGLGGYEEAGANPNSGPSTPSSASKSKAKPKQGKGGTPSKRKVGPTLELLESKGAAAASPLPQGQNPSGPGTLMGLPPGSGGSGGGGNGGKDSGARK